MDLTSRITLNIPCNILNIVMLIAPRYLYPQGM
jgi:hypothetical protein